MYLIYKVTSPSGKTYIGQTKNFKSRKSCHLSKAKHGSLYCFHQAIRKYGNQLKWEIVLTGLTKAEADLHEQRLIQELNTKAPNGYNLTDGGDTMGGFKWPDALRTRMSQIKKGKDNGCSKLVIDSSTGIIYRSAKEAAELLNVKYKWLTARLSGHQLNNTTLRYKVV